jgi:hypothetical protein
MSKINDNTKKATLDVSFILRNANLALRTKRIGERPP